MRNDFESNYLMHHDFLMHHGIYGQKWGIRRYQNPDGSLTEAGRKRYGVGPGKGVDDINSEKGTKRRIKDVKKSIAKNNKARGKEYSKIANNPENFLGLNKKHGKKIEEYSENIRKGEEEIKRINTRKLEKDEAFWNSEERKKASKEAYDETLKWYKKNEPEELNRMIKENGGDDTTLDSFSGFRKMFEGYEDKYTAKAQEEADKKSSSSEKSSGLSEKAIKSRVEYAKNTGMFDMEFLERIDRYVDEENHSQAEVLKGYEKYLKEHGDEFYKKK